jgi:hypothetical protein
VALAGRPRRADPGRDPTADRHHQRDGARPARLRGAGREIAARLEGHLFVAHNARFDYGFLKNAFARAQVGFTADVLCTVRLSRRLQPEESGHGLDALVERWGLAGDDRHRALGDARLVARLIEQWLAKYPSIVVQAAVKRLLKLPSLPPQLAPESLDGIPDAPGVYVFHGVNDLPLYVGKSISLRERIRSHFSSDYRNANDARLSAEVRRIDWEPTAGELGALMLESQWVKTRFPLLNRALRANADSWLIEAPREDDAAPRLVALSSVPPAQLAGYHGPFKDKRAARSMLQKLAADAGLCWTMLGWSRGAGPASRTRCASAPGRAWGWSRARRTASGWWPRCRRGGWWPGPTPGRWWCARPRPRPARCGCAAARPWATTAPDRPVVPPGHGARRGGAGAAAGRPAGGRVRPGHLPAAAQPARGRQPGRGPTRRLCWCGPSSAGGRGRAAGGRPARAEVLGDAPEVLADAPEVLSDAPAVEAAA